MSALNDEFKANQEFLDYWKKINDLAVETWQRWFHTHKESFLWYWTLNIFLINGEYLFIYQRNQHLRKWGWAEQTKLSTRKGNILLPEVHFFLYFPEKLPRRISADVRLPLHSHQFS